MPLPIICFRVIKTKFQPISNIQLHPTIGNMYVNDEQSIKSIEIRSGIVIQSFGTKFLDRNNTRFTISPCGSILFSSTSNEIISWNLVDGSQISEIIVPISKSYRCYISSLDYHPHDHLLCATVYGPNGGLYLFGCKILIEPPITQNSNLAVNEKEKTVNSIVPNNEYTDLAKIIQKIDDIFLLPQNKTDDLKSSDAKNENKYNSEIFSNSDRSISGNSNTFEINRPTPIPEILESDSSEQSDAGTFTIEKPSNRTFSIPVSSASNDQQPKNGTYSIENIKPAIEYDSDDTTISESL